MKVITTKQELVKIYNTRIDLYDEFIDSMSVCSYSTDSKYKGNDFFVQIDADIAYDVDSYRGDKYNPPTWDIAGSIDNIEQVVICDIQKDIEYKIEGDALQYFVTKLITFHNKIPKVGVVFS